MKKIYVLIFVIVLSIISFTIFLDADTRSLSKEEALSIGEEKYLSFLWLVDGAFNETRYEYAFLVNNKELEDDMKTFTCNYPKNNKRTCIGKNFETAFHSLFANNVTIDDVYSDRVSFSWYEKNKDEYKFTNINTCNAYRMGQSHNLQIISIDKKKISFRVTFVDERSNRVFDKLFVLTYEDGDWKVSKAYYHDPCYTDYNIE